MKNRKLTAILILLFAIFVSTMVGADVVAKLCTRVAQPTDSPGAGTYGSAQTVTLSDTYSGAFICYTTDGSTPTFASGACVNGTHYTTGFSVSVNTTVNAIACGTNYSCSTTLTSAYTISGAGAPTIVNAFSCTTGASQTCTTNFSPTNGNTLIVFAGSAAATAFTCSDAEGTGNNYVNDGSITGSGFNLVARVFRAANISGTGTYAITCTGTTPNIHIIEISGNRSLAAVSAGTNPSMLQSATSGTLTPASMTTTDANVLFFDYITSLTGDASFLPSQVDASFSAVTGITPCTNGGTCFVSNIGKRSVTSTGTYSDGWSVGNGTNIAVIHVGYK